MHKEFINQLHSFQKVSVPKYIDVKIQNVALKHLELPDMGKLKDRMDGQLYYDKLKIDLLAEYAFENIVGIKKFDWIKRENKNYRRKQYDFNRKVLKLITFVGENLPTLNEESANNYVYVYVNPDNRVYISGLATKNILKELLTTNEANINKNIDFGIFIKFTSLEELLDKIE